MSKNIIHINFSKIPTMQLELKEKLKDQSRIILTNDALYTRCYGMLVLDYVFKELSELFNDKILEIIVNVDDDNSALFSAIKLGYKKIIYTGKSAEASHLLGALEMDNIDQNICILLC